MYEFHYKCIKIKNSAKFSFTDTGSLVYKIKTEVVYKGFYKDNNLFDFSDFTRDSSFLILQMKKLLGKWTMNSEEK